LVLTSREQKRTIKTAITLLQVKTNPTTPAKSTKTILFDRKTFSKNSPKKRMNFDKASPKKTQPATANYFPQRNETTAQLCGKTAQLATLPRNNMWCKAA